MECSISSTELQGVELVLRLVVDSWLSRIVL